MIIVFGLTITVFLKLCFCLVLQAMRYDVSEIIDAGYFLHLSWFMVVMRDDEMLA